MQAFQFANYTFNTKVQLGKTLIQDVIRHKWLVLTPEEWVRQNVLQYLITNKKYPTSLISVEKKIQCGPVTKRFDIVIYNQATVPYMVVECKAQDVPLTPAVLHQVATYQASLQCNYVIVTNGMHWAGWLLKPSLVEIFDIPTYLP